MLIFSIPVCNVNCRIVITQYLYCSKGNILLECNIIIFLMPIKSIQSLRCEIMIDQVISGQLTKQLIQDLDCSIAPKKGFVSALNYEIRPVELNGSEHTKVYSFCSKLTIYYTNYFNEVYQSNNGDSLTYKTRICSEIKQECDTSS